MKRVVQTAVVSMTLCSLIGCSNLTNQDIGTVTGGLAGGLLGSQLGNGSGRVLAIGAGALAGAYIGNAIGRSMDATDKLKAQQAIEHTPAGQASSWQNPDNGNRYTVQPIKTYQSNNGQPCREYTMTANIGGKMQKVYGTACRQADGSWQTQN